MLSILSDEAIQVRLDSLSEGDSNDAEIDGAIEIVRELQSERDNIVAALRTLRQTAFDYIEEYDRPGEWLDPDGSYKDWESEAEGREAEARLDTIDACIALVTTGTPIFQGIGQDGAESAVSV